MTPRPAGANAGKTAGRNRQFGGGELEVEAERGHLDAVVQGQVQRCMEMTVGRLTAAERTDMDRAIARLQLIAALVEIAEEEARPALLQTELSVVPPGRD
jgi:hypothetical protein